MNSHKYTKSSGGALSYTISTKDNSPYKNNIYGAMLIETDERNKQNRLNHFNKTGDSRVNVEKGTEDRLNAIPYSNMDTNSRAISGYNYGYYEKGTRTISARIDILSQEELEAIGYNDSLDSNIDFNLLPEVIRTNSYYLKGYNKKGRSR